MRLRTLVSARIGGLIGLIARSMTLGVRVAVFDASGRVLLVRHTYVPGWYFPGGGVEIGETLAAAAEREIGEETGVCLCGPLRLVSMHLNAAVSRRDHVAFFVGRAQDGRPRITRPREIAAADFFALEALPDGVTPATRRRLEEWCGGAPAAPHW